MSETTTRGLRIRARPSYVPEQSSPEEGRYLFAYHISIENGGNETVRLLSRHWIITDGDGDTSEVEGQGVVGEQPELQPGQSFEYTSACPLPTPVGTMHGSFRMVTESGEQFDALINAFTLAIPGALN
ncbi:MAG: Co2+/Mg2+ efflux protein ApaG [Salinisphaeraceae bacterium]|nr:Co2+/Mg2+ efflux protein ApaG [Salinisphaeraceae bacterium]